jgi:hypothetical protein
MASNVFQHPAAAQKIELRQWQARRVSDILERPAPPLWIWNSRIMRGTVTLLGGEAKIGKSFLLQQLMSCCAVGIPCLGEHTERVRCFGNFCEDPDDHLINRQFDINAALGIDMLDFDDRYFWRSAAADDCTLATFQYGEMKLTAEWDRLWREVEYQRSELVVIDTAGAVFQGNHFLKERVTPFMRALQAKAIEGCGGAGLAIVLSSHPPTGNVAKGYSGDSAWLASARAAFSLERPADYDRLTNTPANELVLRGIGANYTGGRSIDRLRWSGGVLVVDEEQPMPRRTDTAVTREIMDEEMLRGLALSRDHGESVPADWHRQGSMQRRYRATFDRRAAWNDLNASFERLARSGKIVLVRVRGQCLVRRADGFPYQDETAW